ncbi:MAG TPA: DUF4097 family beta strand repeat-containing protein [Thermoanaerobaculia bacterium]|nr:DUF4097 family beta strand repeat-containing protein [Thermoanaerobaculia bacterium]
MRTVISLIAPVAGLILTVFAWRAAEAATLTEKFDKTYSVKSNGDVELHNVNGSVTVEAWDQNHVRVQAEKKVKADDDKARELMKQLQIEVTETGGGLRIVTRMPKRNGGLFDWMSGDDVSVGVEYKIWVPRDAQLDFENTNGKLTVKGIQGRAELETTNGGIAVDGAGGELELGTTNGGIEVTRSAGVLRANTTNGSIDIQLDAAPNADQLSLSTTNGGIILQVPRNAGMTLDAAATNGRVSSDFEVSGHAEKRRLEGDVNGGGSRVKLRTTNGSIRIVAG